METWSQCPVFLYKYCPNPSCSIGVQKFDLVAMASGRIVLPNSAPVGYRFQPTDEEIVGHFLKNKMLGNDHLVHPIPEVDVCQYEPWELPNFSMVDSDDLEWFFFSIRDFKYCHGRRWNRATRGGYWKTTGVDRKIIARRTNSLIGTKKTLVFYKGRVPNGIRTNWVMHEYHSVDTYHQKTVYVVCRLKKKYDDKIVNGDSDLPRRTIESAFPEVASGENGGLLLTRPLPEANTEDEIDIDEFVKSLIVDGEEFHNEETADPFDYRFVESQWTGSTHLEASRSLFEDIPPNSSAITESSSWIVHSRMRMMRRSRKGSDLQSNHIFDTNVFLERSFPKTEHEERHTHPISDGIAASRIRLQRKIGNAAENQIEIEEASKYSSNDGCEKNKTRTRPPSEYFANVIIGFILLFVFAREMVLYGEWGCKF